MQIFCRQGEETLLYLLSRCDAVVTKRSRNLSQHQVRAEEIPDPELHNRFGVGWIVIKYPRMKNGGKIDLDRSSCLCDPNSQYNNPLP